MQKAGLYENLDDLELMSFAAGDDREAFAEIYNRYKRPLYLHAYKMLGNREEAKDVLQDVFAGLWGKRHSIEVESDLSPYLYRSVKHRILNLISRKKTQDRYLESLAAFIEESENITDLQVRENELQELIEQEMTRLPPKMREVFELSSRQDLSYKEIGELLGISDKTVKKQVHNARAILRNRLAMITVFLYCFWS